VAPALLDDSWRGGASKPASCGESPARLSLGLEGKGGLGWEMKQLARAGEGGDTLMPGLWLSFEALRDPSVRAISRKARTDWVASNLV